MPKTRLEDRDLLHEWLWEQMGVRGELVQLETILIHARRIFDIDTFRTENRRSLIAKLMDEGRISDNHDGTFTVNKPEKLRNWKEDYKNMVDQMRRFREAKEKEQKGGETNTHTPT